VRLGCGNRIDHPEECFASLKQPIVRITTPHIPLPSADRLEDAVLPTPARIVSEVRRFVGKH